MKTRVLILLLLFICFTFSSCSKDDDEMDCVETNFSMVVNGEVINFQNLGYGIDWDWENGGHDLQLNYYHNSEEHGEQNVYFMLRHMTAGKNIIEEFHYSAIRDENGESRNLVNEGLQSDIIINRNTCFYATFSGTFNVGDQEIVLGDGKASCIYDEPMDGITIE